MRVEQVAVALGLGRSACYEAIGRGEIPSLRIGRRLFVQTAELRRLLGMTLPFAPPALTAPQNRARARARRQQAKAAQP